MIRRGLEFNAQLIVVGQQVDNGNIQVTRIAFFSIFGDGSREPNIVGGGSGEPNIAGQLFKELLTSIHNHLEALMNTLVGLPIHSFADLCSAIALQFSSICAATPVPGRVSGWQWPQAHALAAGAKENQMWSKAGNAKQVLRPGKMRANGEENTK